MRRLLVFGALALGATGCGPGTHHAAIPNASPSRGKNLIEYVGCGACHMIGGVRGANGHVGPSLKTFPEQRQIAGLLPNTTPNLIRWIMHPQQIAPGTDMPDLGLTYRQARDVAAYLYTGQ